MQEMSSRDYEGIKKSVKKILRGSEVVAIDFKVTKNKVFNNVVLILCALLLVQRRRSISISLLAVALLLALRQCYLANVNAIVGVGRSWHSFHAILRITSQWK